MISVRAVALNKETTNNWIDLPKTSEWLTERQIFPVAGDAVVLVADDGRLVGFDTTSLKNIMTVKRRWIRHSIADVLVVLEYEPW
jgi:hypothetical protein